MKKKKKTWKNSPEKQKVVDELARLNQEFTDLLLERAREVLGKRNLNLGRPKARKYFANRPASSTERVRKFRSKKRKTD